MTTHTITGFDIAPESGVSGILTVYYDDGGCSIPLGAIAAYSELLGIPDVVDAVDAILHVRWSESDTPCPKTNRTPWTDIYAVKTHLEQVRERAAQQATDQPWRAEGYSLEAYAESQVENELHRIGTPTGCLLRKVREQSCHELGIPTPSYQYGSPRGAEVSCDDAPRVQTMSDGSRTLTGERRGDLAKLLRGNFGATDETCLDVIRRRKRQLAHEISDMEDDPLGDGVYVVDPDDDINSLRIAYGGDALED